MLHEPLLNTPAPGPTARSASILSSSVTLFKAIVGTGMFALPPAVRETGWALGCVMVVILAVVSAYTMCIIIGSIRALRERGGVGGPDGRVEFQQMTQAAFNGGALNALVMLIAVLGQIGSIIGFIAFCTSNIVPLHPSIERWHVALLYSLFLAPLSLLRTTTHPAFSSVMHFGNAAVAVAIASVLYFGFTQRGCRPLVATWESSGIGLAFGVDIFMFTGYMEVVSIEQDMRDRSSFVQMIVWTLTAVTGLYLAFGLLVYSFFGDETGRVQEGGQWVEATILQNLPAGSAIVAAVKLAFSANLLLMSPIILLPASKATEEALGVDRSSRPKLYSCVTRLSLVATMGVGALVLPSFELVTAIIGALTALTGFTVPAICYLRFRGDSIGLAHRFWLGAVGALGIFGTAYSLIQLAQ
jgi:amino acid permease